MTIISDNQRAERRARAWKTREPHPTREGATRWHYLTEWSHWQRVLRFDGVELVALPKKRGELVRWLFRTGNPAQWLLDVSGARTGEPWERAYPSRPYRKPLTAREAASCAVLAELIPYLHDTLSEWSVSASAALELKREGRIRPVVAVPGCAGISDQFSVEFVALSQLYGEHGAPLPGAADKPHLQQPARTTVPVLVPARRSAS